MIKLLVLCTYVRGTKCCRDYSEAACYSCMPEGGDLAVVTKTMVLKYMSDLVIITTCKLVVGLMDFAVRDVYISCMQQERCTCRRMITNSYIGPVARYRGPYRTLKLGSQSCTYP